MCQKSFFTEPHLILCFYFFHVSFPCRYGPHFETGNVTNITVQVGNTFYLHCKISLLQDKTVSCTLSCGIFRPFFLLFSHSQFIYVVFISILSRFASKVSWVRRKSGENGLELLTVGKQTYSGDPRYSVDFQYPNNWRLKIVSAQKIDEATYEWVWKDNFKWETKNITRSFFINLRMKSFVKPFCLLGKALNLINSLKRILSVKLNFLRFWKTFD